MKPELNRIYLGDHLGKKSPKVLPEFDDNVFDSVVTDPPYELGFMGKSWDSTGVAYSVEFWTDVLRVMKPGAHLLAFGGTRTFHRMACAIEDAGFEVRDMMEWVYGSGFPKSLDVSKAIDKHLGATRKIISERPAYGIGGKASFNGHKDGATAKTTEAKTTEAKTWSGCGTALKPAQEPICMARKPLSEKNVAANVLRWGVGALNIDASRIEFQSEADEAESKKKNQHADFGTEPGGNAVYGDYSMVPKTNYNAPGRWPPNLIVMHHPLCVALEKVHACVPDCPMRIMDAQSGQSVAGVDSGARGSGGIWAKGNGVPCGPQYGDTGGASRFFYCAKPDKTERHMGLEDSGGNEHATVKPVDLMTYLIRLVTPRGGVILDPFLGSGTTAIAAARLGYKWVGIEMEEKHVDIAKARISAECDGKLF